MTEEFRELAKQRAALLVAELGTSGQWRTCGELPRDVVLWTVTAEIEAVTGEPLPVGSFLVDEILATAVERDVALWVVVMWIRDYPRFPRELPAWLDYYGL